MTRMWPGVEPKSMCTQHLVGEHNELHMIVGCVLSDDMDVMPWVEDGLVNPYRVLTRHEKIVRGAKRRELPMGLDHQSPLFDGDEEEEYQKRLEQMEEVRHCLSKWFQVDCASFTEDPPAYQKNRVDLCARCEDCHERFVSNLEEAT